MKTYEIELVLPTEKYSRQLEEYRQKFRDHVSEIGGVGMHGCGTLEQRENILEWLLECEDYRFGRSLYKGYVPATQFLAVRKADDKLVGMIQVRHALTEHLERIGGHVGYGVAPDERGKGYATDMLMLGLEECKKLGIDRVRVSCIKENIASEKVIKKCGGEYDGDAEHEGKVYNRYWINL